MSDCTFLGFISETPSGTDDGVLGVCSIRRLPRSGYIFVCDSLADKYGSLQPLRKTWQSSSCRPKDSLAGHSELDSLLNLGCTQDRQTRTKLLKTRKMSLRIFGFYVVLFLSGIKSTHDEFKTYFCDARRRPFYGPNAW